MMQDALPLIAHQKTIVNPTQSPILFPIHTACANTHGYRSKSY